jgi:uncharacterized protein YwgA
MVLPNRLQGLEGEDGSMIAHDKLVANVIAAADGEIVGRIRLQKIFYLLDALGLHADASFRYHHYGPYSRILDEALDRAKALCDVTEELRSRRDGALYSVFRGPARDVPASIGELETQRLRELIAIMKKESSTVLELAATIHWLHYVEKLAAWREELVRRKGIKTQGGRVEEALRLLSMLGLAPV